MNDHVDHVLLEALALNPEDRSLVALSLIDSLQGDGAPDDTITASWVAEANRRNEDISTGRSKAMSADEFRDWIGTL
jgi:putative addiction module component (TIGR02574 family)